MKPASQITDRAKRYRANLLKPAGPRRCEFCGSKRNIDVDHISGDETDGDPDNLMYLCRRCNTIKGIVQARSRIGIRTRQFNPSQPSHRSVSFAEYRNATEILTGGEGDAAEATETIRRTGAKRRLEFGERLEQTNNPPTFGQYVYAVSAIHARGDRDEGGKVIHATPPALRSRYALQIARIKASRASARDKVPF